YPPYLAAAALSLVLAGWLYGPNLPESGSSIATLFMLQNYSGSIWESVATRQPSTNAAFWSLPVELELYLAYPIVRSIWNRSGWRSGFLVVGMCSAAALAAYHAGFR